MANKDILYPLRRVHGIIHESMVEMRRILEVICYTAFPMGKKAYVIGTPTHSNVGDSAIVYAEKYFLQVNSIPEERIKEFTLEEFQRNKKWIVPFVEERQLICLHGGGNMGNQWLNEEYFRRDVLACFPYNPTIIFPQTIYYSGDEAGMEEKQKSLPYYSGREKLVLVAREQTSYGQMAEYYPDTKLLLTPDIVLSLGKTGYTEFDGIRSGILMCMRADAERAIDDKTVAELGKILCRTGKELRHSDMHTTLAVTKQTREQVVRDKMEEFLSAELAITDRLHGMIFSAVTGTPCIAFSNYNHKVSGTYQWLKELKYIRYVDSVEEAERCVAELLELGECVYDPAMLAPHFEKLAEVVREYACN